jgi:hypothetical protein
MLNKLFNLFLLTEPNQDIGEFIGKYRPIVLSIVSALIIVLIIISILTIAFKIYQSDSDHKLKDV